MPEKSYLPARMEVLIETAAVLTRRDIARRCGVHPRMIDCLVALGLLDPAGRGPDQREVFSREMVARLEKIVRLRNDLGVNYAGIGVVLELLSRIEELEERIRALEAASRRHA